MACSGTAGPEERALLEKLRTSLKENINELLAFGLTVEYVSLSEPKYEDLPLMFEVHTGHFYGAFNQKHDYSPLPVFCREGCYVPAEGTLTTLDKFYANMPKDEYHDVEHVMVVGPAGSGKSCVLRRFARGAGTGKFPQFPKDHKDYCVHMLDGRGFDPNVKVSVIEYMFRHLDISTDDTIFEVGLQWMLRSPHKVLLVIDNLGTLGYEVDGVDRGPIPIMPTQPVTSSGDVTVRQLPLDFEPDYPANILYGLLTGSMFPGSRVLTASREHQIRNFKGRLRAGKLISLVGLTNSAIRSLVHGLMGPNDGPLFFDHISGYTDLIVLCKTPLILIFYMIGLKERNDWKSMYVPTTMSGIIVNLLGSLIHMKHSRKAAEVLNPLLIPILNKMKILAFRGLLTGEVLFRDADLKAVGLSREEITDLAIPLPGCGAQDMRLLEGEEVVHFVHQSVQEMLCAIYIAEMPVEKFRKFVRESLNEQYFSVVRRMVCGILLNPRVSREANKQLIQTDNDLSEIRSILIQSLREQMGLSKGGNCVELFHALHETEEGVKEILPAVLPKFSFAASRYYPLDMFAIGCVLRHLTRLEVLDVKHLQPSVESAEEFSNGIHLDGSILKIDTVAWNKRMHQDNFLGMGSILVFCDIAKLEMREVLNETKIRYFANALAASHIDELDASGNSSMKAAAFWQLGRLVYRGKVKSLDMSKCALSSPKLEMFKGSVRATKIHTLRVCGSENMRVKGLTCLANIVELCCVRNLDMANCDLSMKEIQAFNKALGPEKATITHLDLSRSHDMGVASFRILAEIIQKCGVKYLKMQACDVSEKELDTLRLSLSLGQTTLEELDLSQTTYTSSLKVPQPVAALCRFLPHVTHKLDLRKTKTAKGDDIKLQAALDKIGPTELEILIKDKTLKAKMAS